MSGEFARFAAVMEQHGYDWKAHEVVTEDQYILTTFQILGKIDEDRPLIDRGSVLIQHGATMDGTSWLEGYAYTGEKPFQLQLADAGYDVWIGSNRGTEYSQGHETLSAKDDPDYWEFSWAEMGLYDDTANINKIKEVSDREKIFYVGYSQGSLQMFYGLAHIEEEAFADSLYKAVMFAPCFVTENQTGSTPEAETYINSIMAEQEIYATFGPNWEEDKQRLYTALPEMSQLFGMLEEMGYTQAMSWKTWKHFGQIMVTERFQEYADNWDEGEYETDLVRVEDIDKVPIALFIAPNDATCTMDKALEYQKKISSWTTSVIFDGTDHEYFGFASDKYFMQQLMTQMNIDDLTPSDHGPGMKYSSNAAVQKAVSDWQMVKDMSEFASYNPMASNLILAGASFSWASYCGLNAFRYRSASNYYSFAEIGSDTNYYKLSDQIYNFGGIALGGTLTVTSLLAALGIAGEINGWAWYWILAFINPPLELTVKVLRMLAYDSAYDHTQGTDTAKASSGSLVMTAVQTDTVYDLVMGATFMAFLWDNFWAVYYDSWNSLTDERQAEQLAIWEGEVAERAEAIAAKRSKLAPAKKEEAEAEEDEGVEADEEEDEDMADDDEEEEEE